jgi:ankyrin repeat protein
MVNTFMTISPDVTFSGAFAAVQANDLTTVSAFIKQGGDVNRRGPTPYTLLIVAAGKGYVQMTDMLLSAGADVHALDSTLGSSALHKAAQSGIVDVAQLLLDHGAFINLQSATVGHTPLIDAVWAKKPPMTKFLLDRGASVEIRTHYQGTVFDFIGNQIQWTAGFTNPELEPWGHDIRLLLEAKRASDKKAVEGQALMQAVLKNDLAQVKTLIAGSVNVNEKSPVVGSGNDGQTPLLVACFNGYTDIVSELLAAGANPRIVDYLLKATPLHKAAFAGHPGPIHLLLRDGRVEVNAQGPYNGYTALHDSCWHGHKDAMEALLPQCEVARTLVGFDGNTAAGLATSDGYKDMAAAINQFDYGASHFESSEHTSGTGEDL